MYNTLTINNQSKYRVAIYIRLSKEDLDKKDESESVKNQKDLLESYVNEQGYEIVDFYIDDGYTGTNFNRPNFQRMINDLELGKANMVLTKDLSRLGRDYIETGEYVEKYFPKNRIRFVSILDGIDTASDTTNNDIAPFKAVINDMYSKDNSKKIRTALKTKQLKGLWVGGCAPLGYMPDPENRNHLVINEEEAYIVRKIFNWAKKGFTYFEIKEKLNEEKIPTASMLRRKHSNTPMANEGIWCSKTVRRMLENELYLGDMVQNRRSRVSYKVRQIQDVPKERWIVVPNTHEPLVDRKTFEFIQQRLKNCKTRPKKEIYRLFDGLLFCYDCKHRISICKPRKSDGRTYIVCNYYRMYSKQKLCTSHSYNYDKIEEGILKVLNTLFKNILEGNKLNENVEDVRRKKKTKANNKVKLENIINEIKLKTEQLDKMYLDNLSGKISDDMYIRISAKNKLEINRLEAKKRELGFITPEEQNNEEVDKECKQLIEDFLKGNVDRDIMAKLIKRIEIRQNKEFDIYFNFQKLNFLLEKYNH